MEIVNRKDTTFWTKASHTMLRPFASHIIAPPKTAPVGSPKLEVPSSTSSVCNVKERQVQGINLYDLESRKGESTRKRRVYYLPGGAFQAPSSPGHWGFTTALATEVPNTVVTLISYPLAPNNPAPETFPILLELYKALLQESAQNQEDVTIAGDSAGGNLTLALTLEALNSDAEAPAPARLIAITPCCDLSIMDPKNPALREVAKKDPMLSIDVMNQASDAWRGAWPASDPRVSVVKANVSVLATRGVSVFGVDGTHDMCSAPAETFRDLCVQAGVKGKWLTWEGQMHIFPLLFGLGLSESKQGKEWIFDILRSS